MNGPNPPRDPAPPSRSTPARLPPRKYWPWFFFVLFINYVLMSLLFQIGRAHV